MLAVTKPSKAEIREFVRNAKSDLQKLLAALTEDNGRQVSLFLDSSLAMLEEAETLVEERYGLEENDEEEDEEEIESIMHYECVSCETEWTGDGTEDEAVCNFCGEEASVHEFDEE
jgi:hypothetical protein